MTAEETQLETLDDEHMDMLSNHIIHGSPSMKSEVQKEAEPYWPFRDEQQL